MKKLLVIIVIILIVGAGAFFGGMKYGQSKVPQRQQGFQQMGANVGNRFRSGQGGNGFVGGEIISKDDKSVTIQLPDGGSKIIFFSNSTVITKSAEGSLNDLAVSKQIIITGDQNSDGSYTAKTIQLRP
jgi:hypothetical protein